MMYLKRIFEKAEDNNVKHDINTSKKSVYKYNMLLVKILSIFWVLSSLFEFLLIKISFSKVHNF